MATISVLFLHVEVTKQLLINVIVNRNRKGAYYQKCSRLWKNGNFGVQYTSVYTSGTHPLLIQTQEEMKTFNVSSSQHKTKDLSIAEFCIGEIASKNVESLKNSRAR